MTDLKYRISQFWNTIQDSLFPELEEILEAPFSKRLQELILFLDMIRVEDFVFFSRGCVGRPPKKRYAIARAFIAKVVFKIADTKLLIDRLKSDKNLRRVCGFENILQIPSESAFSRAFKEFAISELPQKAHEAMIKYFYKDELVGHVSKDSTAIKAREKPVKKEKNIEVSKTKEKPKKRAAKGCAELTRIEKQASGKMTLEEMIKDLPTDCNIGRKNSSSGHMYAWIGYKLHITVDDNSIPLAAMISSASMNDTQAAIPLAIITSKRVNSLYDLMDSGYYADAIFKHSNSLKHVPIIDFAAKGEAQKAEKEQEKLARKNLKWKPAEAVRYNVRTSVERANARLKDEFGALTVRVKGAIKVFAHLMYGLLVQTADQLIKLTT
jgi:hypothetical protein